MSESTSGGRDEFIAALVVNAAVGLIAIVIFSFLRRRLTWRYDIRRVDHMRNLGYRPGDAFLERPPPQARSFFGWMTTVYNIHESSMIKIAGVDAVMTLRFFKYLLFFFVYMCVVSWAAIGAATVTGDQVLGVNGVDVFSMSAIPEKSHRFVAHLCVSWVFTFFLFYLLRKLWIENIKMRAKWSSVEQLAGRQSTIFIENIPEKLRTDVCFKAFFEGLYPGAISSAQLLRDTEAIRELSIQRDWLITKINNLRGIQELDYKTNHAPAFHNVKCCQKSTRTESIPQYTKELQEVLAKLQEVSTAMKEDPSKESTLIPYGTSGFVTFNQSIPYSQASVVPIVSEAHVFTVREAPEPRDIYWSGLMRSPTYRTIAGALMNVVTFFLVFFYFIPVGFIASLTTLEFLSKSIPFLEPIIEWQPAIRAFLQGFLPSLAMIIFMALLPIILTAMAKLQGTEAFSWINMSVLRRYFIFQLVNFFLVSCLSRAVFRQMQEIIDDPGSIVELLARSLPSSAMTFITYIMIRAFSANIMDLIEPVSLIVTSIKWFLSGTPASYLDAWAPGPYKYGKVLPEAILIGIIGFCFGIIQPVILPFTAFYFFTLYFTTKYLFTYVHVTPFETGGKFFPLSVNRLLFGVGLAQLTILGILGLKKVPIETALMIPLPFLTFAFYYYTNKNLDPLYSFTSVTNAVLSDKARADLTDAERRALMVGVTLPSITEGIMPVLMAHEFGDCVAKDAYIRQLLKDGKITQSEADVMWTNYGMHPEKDRAQQKLQADFQKKFDKSFAEQKDGVFGMFVFKEDEQDIAALVLEHANSKADSKGDFPEVELAKQEPADLETPASANHDTKMLHVDVDSDSADPENPAGPVSDATTQINELVKALSPRSAANLDAAVSSALLRYVQEELAPERFAPKLQDHIWPDLFVKYYLAKKNPNPEAAAAPAAAAPANDVEEVKPVEQEPELVEDHAEDPSSGAVAASV